MWTRKLALLLAAAPFLGGCALEEVFGSVQVVVTGPELLEAVRYRVVSAREEALVAEGEKPMEAGRALIRAPAVRGGARLTLEGRYGGFTYYRAELSVSEPLTYAVAFDGNNRLTVDPTLAFSNLPSDAGADQVALCVREPAFAPSVGSPYCSPGYTAVVQVPVGEAAASPSGVLVSLSGVPVAPAYEVLYLTPTRVYRGPWTLAEAPVWSFDLSAMVWEAR